MPQFMKALGSDPLQYRSPLVRKAYLHHPPILIVMSAVQKPPFLTTVDQSHHRMGLDL